MVSEYVVTVDWYFIVKISSLEVSWLRIRQWCHQNEYVAVCHSLRKECLVRQPFLWYCWT